MNNFREMPLVRALLVALVFVVCFGVFGGDSAFARYERQNGHEGDPGDSYDIVSGGSGSSGEQSESSSVGGKPDGLMFFLFVDSNGNGVFLQPVLMNGILVFEIVVNPSVGGWK